MSNSPTGGADTTVVIPTRNRSHSLAAALRSVSHQTDPPAFVIVVDDGSTPPVEVPRWDGPGRLTLLRRDGRHGESAARNTGLKAVRTGWVAWCDDDDLWAPWKLAEQFAALRRRPDANWCLGEAAVMTGDQVTGYVGVSELAGSATEVERLFLSSNSVGAPMTNLLARTASIRDLGGFDEALPVFADWDLFIRLATLGSPALVQRPLALYRRHPGQMTAHLDEGPSVVSALRERYADRRALHGIHPGDDRVALWLATRQARRSPRAALSSLREAPVLASPSDVGRLLRCVWKVGLARMDHARSKEAAAADLAVLADLAATWC